MAVELSGSGQYLQLPASSLMFQDKSGGTIFCRFNADTFAAAGGNTQLCTFSTNGSADDTRATLRIRESGGSGFIEGGGRPDDVSQVILLGATAISTGEEHSAAVVFHWTGQLFEVYLDGVQDGVSMPAAWTANSVNTPSAASAIGARPDGALFFDGQIEDVIVFPFPLNAVQIMKLHMVGITTNLQGSGVPGELTSWYKLKGQGGTTPTGTDIWGQQHASVVGAPTYTSRIMKARAACAI